MKTPRKRGLFLVVSLLAVSLIGGSLAAVLTQDMDQMMQMMKEKMLNRPTAMMNADQSIQDQKQQAMSEGKYTCCLKHPCDFCALKMGECPCGINAAKDMPVCNECKGSWYSGDGAISGKTPEQIKTMPRGM